MLSPEWSPSTNLHWVDVMSRLRLFNNDILVSMWVGPDGKNSESHIIQVIFPTRSLIIFNFLDVMISISNRAAGSRGFSLT